MKGLSNNTKTIATLFLFVCLAANSQVFQSSLKENTGSTSLASNSLRVERSSLLPSKAKNCALKKDSTVAEQFTADEKDIVNYKLLRERIGDQETIDESGMSAREKRDAALKRRNSIAGKSTANRKIVFKLNYKTYICENEGGAASTELEYELTDINTPEGSIKCPGGCKVAATQTDAFADIANKLLNEGVKDEINLQYEFAKIKLINQQKEDNCEGIFEEYADGSTEFFAYEDNEEDDKLHRECLIGRIKDLKGSKSLDMFDKLEGQLFDLAESDSTDDRKEALRLIKMLHGRSGRGLHQDIKVSVSNIKNYALGANAADLTVAERDKHIEYYKSQACSNNQKPGCLADYYVNEKIKSLQMFKQRELEFGKYNFLNQGWSISKNEGGDESYKTWHTNLTNYFDEKMQQIHGVYTGPADVNKKLSDSSSDNDFNRYQYIMKNSSTNNVVRSNTSSMGKDVGNFPSLLKNFK